MNDCPPRLSCENNSRILKDTKLRLEKVQQWHNRAYRDEFVEPDDISFHDARK